MLQIVRRHATLWNVLVFLLVAMAAAVLFYYRFPNALSHPNFYAEDGTVLTKNLLHYGIWRAMLITFNGYFISGMYLLAELGRGLNIILYGGQLADLPKAYALVSYGFLGFTAALPIILLRPYLKLAWRLLLALAIIYVPLTTYDYAIIGIIGNFKFLFVPIAFMLLLYRLKLPRQSRIIILIDLALLICGYTNVTVYLLLPSLLLADGLRPRQLKDLRGVLRRDNIALWSALGLGLLLLIQLIVVKINGIPAIPGYLDYPFTAQPLLEIEVARSYLYPLVYWWYPSLTDTTAVSLLVCIAALMWRFGRREHRWIYGIGLLIIAAATSLFVLNRPGVTALFKHYMASGPDQFFFGQNIIFLILLALLFGDALRRLSIGWQASVAIVLGGLLLLPAGQAGSYGQRDFMQHDIGTIKANAQQACQDSMTSSITLTLYPTSNQHLTVPRAQICTAETMDYQPDEVNLGLKAAGGAYISLSSTPPATQQFTSTRNNLAGISLYLATFSRPSSSPYQLIVDQADCKTELRRVDLPATIEDNAFLAVHFKPIAESRGRQFCFQVTPKTTPASPLAAWYTAPGAYADGALHVNGAADARSLVFRLLYPNVN